MAIARSNYFFSHRSYSTISRRPSAGVTLYPPPVQPLPTFVAIKDIRIQPDQVSTSSADLIYKHIINQTQLIHPNIWPSLGYTLTNTVFPAIVTPYCDHGSVEEYCRSHKEANRLELLRDTACGLQYLHNLGFSHQNIIPANILINEDGRACVSDTGIYELFSQLSTNRDRNFIPPFWAYKPPEVLNPIGNLNLQSLQMADVYSFGCTAYEMISGLPPYKRAGYPGLYLVLKFGHLTIPQHPSISDQLWDVIRCCWDLNPKMRPSMTEVVAKLSLIR